MLRNDLTIRRLESFYPIDRSHRTKKRSKNKKNDRTNEKHYRTREKRSNDETSWEETKKG